MRCSSLAVAFAFVVVVANRAAADPEVTGMVVTGPGEVSGEVTGTDGKPLAGIKVHVAMKGKPEQVAITDAKGHYRATLLDRLPAYVFVDGKVKLAGSTSVAVKTGDTEAIETHEPLAPAVQPKALGVAKVPDYSEQAEDKNTWARAWLLLDVDATGKVVRVKLLDKPGLDLDRIAVRDALLLKFEPARDRANKKVEALVVWTYEWPAYSWMQEHMRVPNELPWDVGTVYCATAGHAPSYKLRDCKKPTIANAVSLPWITKP